MSLLQYCHSGSTVRVFIGLPFQQTVLLTPLTDTLAKCLGVGAYARDKNTSARLGAKIAEGLMHEGGPICRTLRYIHCDYGCGFCVIAPMYVLAAIMSSELCGQASALTGRVWERG